MGQGQSSQAAASLPASAQVAVPVGHPPVLANSDSSAPPPSCPMHRGEKSSPATPEAMNPLNNMPTTISQSRSQDQSILLPTERTISSIPRTPGSPEESNKWEYPSPQQFYNALVRKGWETPEEHIETMVDLHNVLNETAWREVLKWEGLSNPTSPEPELSRFQGRPGELSPKARAFLLAGRILPSRFNSEPPFDRHDWIVKRKSGEEVRYVIDYYSAGEDENNSPVFALDVRPALDSFGGFRDRFKMATRELWSMDSTAQHNSSPSSSVSSRS